MGAKKEKYLRSKNIPATYAQVQGLKKIITTQNISLRSELKSHGKRFKSIESMIKARDRHFEAIAKQFETVRTEIKTRDKRFDFIDKRFEAIDATLKSHDERFDSLELKMEAGFTELKTEIHKFMALMHDQEARNIRVIDSHNNLSGRQDRLEYEIKSIKKSIGSI